MWIGRYRAVSHLGRGGMADIFKCQLAGIGGFDKTVVVKQMLPHLRETPEFVKMFLDEARLAAGLSHPNIVQIFEIAETDGVPYIVMEYVHGPTLSQLMRQAITTRDLPLQLPTRIFSDICLALDHAHNARGPGGPLHLVHRDVSPQNIIVSTDGVAKLLDFGIAKASAKMSQTEAGTMKGKIAFVPPEQIRGENVSCSADIYSVGVCLYLCTTGRVPFGGDSQVSMLQAVLQGEFRKPSEHNPRIPPELEAAILWAMQSEAAARPATARALREALEGVLSGAGRSDGEAVAEWVKRLFPNAEFEKSARPIPEEGSLQTFTPTSGVYAPTPSGPGSPFAGSLSSARALGSTPGSATGLVAAPRPARSLLVPVLIGLLLLAGGGAGVALFREELGLSRPPPVAAPAGATGTQTAVAYLDEIERLRGEKKYSMALELLAKARELSVDDPAVTIRLGRVTDAVEREAYLAMGRRALAAGDAAHAQERAKQVLERDFDDAEARALLDEAQAKLAPQEPAAAAEPSGATAGKGRAPARDARRATAAPGKLLLTSSPPAAVYVDNRPAGKTPLAAMTLSAGHHQVELRLAGYLARTEHVEVRSGETVTLSVTLQQQGRSFLTATEASEAPAASSAAVAPPAPVAPEKPAQVAAAGRSDPAPRPPDAKPAPPEPAAAAAAPGTAALPAPAAAPAALVTGPAPAAKPRLPAVHQAPSIKELVRALRIVESELVTRGNVPEATATNVTAALAEDLAASFAPGQTIEIYPTAMYYLVVQQAAAGHDRARIAGALKRAHKDRSLLGYAGK